jgi:uncharacterized protein (TIGR02246 family)
MGSAREVFEKGQKAFNAHDLEGIIEIYSQDAVATGPGGMEFRGHDAIREYTKGWLQGFPDAKLRDTNVIEAGDTIVEEGVFTGTHTGIFPTPMGDIPPTGKPVEGNYVDIFVIRDGKVVSDHLFFDRLELMEQLGLAPAPAGATR